jgi:hypothetical protein
MPKAVATQEEHLLELKSVEGGFIKARRLSYGEKLQRRAMTSGLKLDIGSRKKGTDTTGEMQLITEESTLFDFKHCILDHNLFKDEEETQKLDLTNKMDLRMLDPRVGEEIDAFLSELNNFEEDEEGN